MKLNSRSLVVELGSNDGYLLQYFVEKGIPVLGIEPAANVAKIAEDKGVRTLCEFFGVKSAAKLKENGQQADVIIANNVLAHIADLNGVIEGIRILLKENGRAVIEAPYVKDMIDRCEFDTIYHEHLCYFSATAIDNLLKSHNLMLVDVERLPIHGGSLRYFMGHAANNSQSERLKRMLKEEKDWGVYQTEFYMHFSHMVEEIRSSLRSLLSSLKKEGKHIAGYGAAAKGTVLMNHCQIGTDMIDFVVDANPLKQGHYIPGVHIPVKAPAELLAAMPDYTLLLIWNLKDEILKQQSEYIKKGGKFILPVPQVKIL
jgi:SAM-dependent methyltransferase